MSDEVRKAAERLMDIQAVQYGNVDVCEVPVDVVTAALRLAHAYLDEHPADDDEPVTEEWLRATGIEYRSIYRGDLFEPDIFYECGPLAGDFASIPLIRRTRGDVRRLCHALGIPFKE